MAFRSVSMPFSKRGQWSLTRAAPVHLGTSEALWVWILTVAKDAPLI